MDPIQARPLLVSEWSAYKEFRLMALQSAAGMFATSVQEASGRSADEWRAVIVGLDHQVFGLFDGAKLIGITGVFGGRSDADRDTAFLVMSFILPEYRGRGLSHCLYRARLDWIRTHGKFRRAIAAIRASNGISQQVCQHFGFTCTGRKQRRWPDGATEDELIYELRLAE